MMIGCTRREGCPAPRHLSGCPALDQPVPILEPVTDPDTGIVYEPLEREAEDGQQSPEPARCSCGALTLETTVSERHDRGLHGPERCTTWLGLFGMDADFDGDEVRVTSPTGGQKGTKAERYDLIPHEPLRQLAILYGRGAEKYEPRNWERGYPWSLSYAAALRHMTAYWRGEDVDPEMGVPHLICAAFHLLGLTEFLTTQPDFDDRPGGKR